jgi:hypothetical protein
MNNTLSTLPADSGPTFEQAFAKLRSRRIGERIEAEVALQAMGPAAIDGLLAVISKEQRTRRRRRNIYFGIVALFCLTCLPAAAWVVYTALATHNPGLFGALGGILGGGGGGLLGGFAWLLAPTQNQVLANGVLSRIEDKRAVGPLLQALQSVTTDPFSRTAAGIALLKIAHKLHKDDETHIDAEQRACLNKALRATDPRRESDFLAALLVLAAKVGDAETLVAIEPLTHKTSSHERESNVLQMARESYDQLKWRIERSRDSATLLRPTAAGAPDSLLRPASGVQTMEDQLLLRPTASE